MCFIKELGRGGRRKDATRPVQGDFIALWPKVVKTECNVVVDSAYSRAGFVPARFFNWYNEI